MKNYYKTILVASALTLLGPLQALALNDVTLESGGDAIINVAGINLTLSPASVTDSVQVDSSSFTVTISNNGSMTIVSTDRRTMTFSQPDGQSPLLTTTLVCTTADSTYTIGNPTAGATNLQITVTPTTNTCSTSGGGSGSSGSGSTTGGGGGDPYAGTRVTTTAAVKSATVTKPVVVTPTPVATTVTPVATTASQSPLVTLKVGQSNPIVRVIQVILNLDPKTKVASSGPGSPGKETAVFGNLTVNAIKKLQAASGIAKQGDAEYGTLGQKTVLKLIDVLVERIKVLQDKLNQQKASGN
ncbi:MAG: hypothetical protein HZA94_00880 [Candidatus Vogelbacteria bacterium]|nr:hypothetical protein [Candidatus Vogelbacteria bacterium]